NREASSELSQLLTRMQTLMAKAGSNSQPNQGQAHAAEQAQAQDQGTAQGQGLNREASSELSQLLTRLQTLMAKTGSNSQPNQGQAHAAEQVQDQGTAQGKIQGQAQSQVFDSEKVSDLRQILHRLQTVLGRAEGTGQHSAAGEKVVSLGDDGPKSTQGDMRASQAVLSPQPQPARPAPYYLQASQASEQARPEGSAKPEFIPLAAEGQLAGGNKDGLTGQGRSSLAEAMLQNPGSGGKGQAGAGSGPQFTMSSYNPADGSSGSGQFGTGSGTPGAATSQAAGSQNLAAQTSGTQQAFEQSMVDQVRFRLSQGARSGQQEVVVRMHPRELGEVRLSLTSDDGNLRAHLHVQSQQVQDVLERNMPRLREALAEQGIDVDDFVFSSDDQGQEREYRSFEQEKWAGRQSGSEGIKTAGPEPHPKAQHNGYSAEKGLSVRI
ncbi:MAG: flagellar hook-length control protein FliK, partial [Desulfovermiculus sp.]